MDEKTSCLIGIRVGGSGEGRVWWLVGGWVGEWVHTKSRARECRMHAWCRNHLAPRRPSSLKAFISSQFCGGQPAPPVRPSARPPASPSAGLPVRLRVRPLARSLAHPPVREKEISDYTEITSASFPTPGNHGVRQFGM